MFDSYPDVLTVSDVQKALTVGRNAVYRLIKEKRLKSIRIGKSLRIPKRYLIDFICENCYTDADINGRILSQVKEETK